MFRQILHQEDELINPQTLMFNNQFKISYKVFKDVKHKSETLQAIAFSHIPVPSDPPKIEIQERVYDLPELY